VSLQVLVVVEKRTALHCVQSKGDLPACKTLLEKALAVFVGEEGRALTCTTSHLQKKESIWEEGRKEGRKEGREEGRKKIEQWCSTALRN
jgi:hypothetical protein